MIKKPQKENDEIKEVNKISESKTDKDSGMFYKNQKEK